MLVLLAMLLLSVGVADIVRSWRAGHRAARAAALVAAVVTPVVSVAALGLRPGQWWVAAVIAAVAAGWLLVTASPRAHAPSLGVALLVLSVVIVLAFGQHLDLGRGPVVRWYESLEVAALDGVEIDRFLLGLACLVFLHSSANMIVRLVLAGAGPQVLETENTLKGGRILGPLERWFIFALALAGQPGAIAAVVAAKGIVRFPEISRADVAGNKAEYVLVGSFVSWLLALVFVPLF